METKEKLKVGDKIIYIAESSYGFTNKKEYTIFEINEEALSFTVINDKGIESFFALCNFNVFFKLKEETAYKETNGKLFYELDFEFITQMAERMASNKGKYEPFNWQKPMEEKYFKELLQAVFRHSLEIVEGNFEDDGREFGHLEAIACDVMMICYQLKKYKNHV